MNDDTLRVLMFTRRVDADDWLAGFAHTWIGALGRHPRVRQLDVICLEMGRHDLPENVSVASMGKERGYSRPRELWEFYRALGPVVGKADVAFGHMIPRYTLAASPWLLANRVPVVQWYTHRQVTTELRLVHAFARQMVTASPESFRLPSRKLTILGHGIDTGIFHPADPPPADRLLVAVGRLSPIKHYEALINGLAALTSRPGYDDVRLAIAGGTTPQDGDTYAQTLRDRAASLGVADRIDFLGPVPHDEVPALYRRAAATVNLCPTGGLDKAVLESMASAVPVVVRNQSFLPMLGDDAAALWCRDLDPACVADHLAATLDASPQDRAALGSRLRDRVRAGHDLDGLIDRLVTVLAAAAGKP